MAIIKCKMCGGDLNIVDGSTVAECEYCGTRQTVPTADNEKKMTLFARANRLLRSCEFDKAAGIFESIAAEFPQEAEAYWGLVLCKYGIEYVDDPATGKKVPTCHRTSFDSVLEDDNFEQAQENADAVARRVYRDEAKAIEELRKGIIEVSGKEEPYDIFICYKETDDNGDRTLDSVLAQDVYDALTENGYRVFFARISLEDKLGTEYEPYIFAALNSAKIMLAFGTDYEYYNAVWVKNEWSRFLALIASGQKKVLIPCFKNLDPYDMPKEFAKLQAQDMGKVGAIQDLLRGIGKILPKNETTQPVQQGPSVENYVRRGELFLEDGDWENAEQYFDKALDLDAESGEAYLGKLMAKLQLRNRGELAENQIKRRISFWEKNDPVVDPLYQKALRFGSEEIRSILKTFSATRSTIIKQVVEEREARRREAERQRQEAERPAKEKALQAEKERLKDLALLRTSISPAQCMISAGGLLGKDYGGHSVGVRIDGTVVATGDNDAQQCEVSSWRDIVAVAAGTSYTVGLKSDGTVVAVGENGKGQCDVSGWKDIVAVSAGFSHTVGLKADGTVVAVGRKDMGQCDVSGWRNIVALAAGSYHTLGLKADGTVVATGYNRKGQCDVSGWRNIVALAAGSDFTLGLKADGTVVCTSSMSSEVSRCKDIVAIFADWYLTGGVKSDGTVVVDRSHSSGIDYRTDAASTWKDIVAVSSSSHHVVGLKADGKTVAAGKKDKDRNHTSECNVFDWKLFDNVRHISQEREECKRIAEAKQQYLKRIAAEERQKKIDRLCEEKKALENENAELHGLFSGGRRKKIEARLAEIESELKLLQK